MLAFVFLIFFVKTVENSLYCKINPVNNKEASYGKPVKTVESSLYCKKNPVDNIKKLHIGSLIRPDAK